MWCEWIVFIVIATFLATVLAVFLEWLVERLER